LSIPMGCGLAVLFCVASAIVGFEETRTGDPKHSQDQDHSP